MTHVQGSWKPSLNIITVLKSIQLLMAEPNPDDGLMADIVRARAVAWQTLKERCGLLLSVVYLCTHIVSLFARVISEHNTQQRTPEDGGRYFKSARVAWER